MLESDFDVTIHIIETEPSSLSDIISDKDDIVINIEPVIFNNPSINIATIINICGINLYDINLEDDMIKDPYDFMNIHEHVESPIDYIYFDPSVPNYNIPDIN